jgi:hypothetical protein
VAYFGRRGALAAMTLAAQRAVRRIERLATTPP